MMKWKQVAEERVNALVELPVGGKKEIWIADTSHKIFDECFPPMKLAKREHDWRVDIRNELRRLLKAKAPLKPQNP